MSTNTNKKKAAQLGMPYGTAANRLRRMMTLRHLQKLGEDFCYRCGEKITNDAELSIEHKVPWFDSDPKLFWDLKNVTYSHRGCNKPDRQAKGEKVSDGTLSPLVVRHIRQRMQSPGQTQVDLARELGITQSCIGRVVRGERWTWVD